MPTKLFLIEYTKETQNPLNHGQSISEWLQTFRSEHSEHTDATAPRCIEMHTDDGSPPNSIEKTVKRIWKSKQIKETSCYMLLGLTNVTQDEAATLSTSTQTSKAETARVTLYATTFEFNGTLHRYRFTEKNRTAEKIQENIMGNTPGTLQDCTLFETLKIIKQAVCVAPPRPYLEILSASDPSDDSKPTVHIQKEPCTSRENAITRVKALLKNQGKGTPPEYSIIFHAADGTSRTLIETVVVTICPQTTEDLREITLYSSDSKIGIGIDSDLLKSNFFIAVYLMMHHSKHIEGLRIYPPRDLLVSAASLTTHLILHNASGQITREIHGSKKEALRSATSYAQGDSCPYIGFTLENAHTKNSEHFTPVKLLIKRPGQPSEDTIRKYHVLFSPQPMSGYIHMDALKTFQAFREATQRVGINLSENETVVVIPHQKKSPKILLSCKEQRIITNPIDAPLL